MLNLKLPTDPRWANIAEQNLDEVLIDHAFCEQKAASTAISFIVNYPEYEELVIAMADLVKEEMTHFQMVHNIMMERGYKMGWERKDEYVARLKKFIPQGLDRKKALIYRLLFAAIIEARSCERFKVLSENIKDKELSEFYFDLMKSEATHYTMFLAFARKYGVGIIDVEKVWENFLEEEKKIIADFGKKEFIHG
ncbi:MAG: tRNA-(ms[2]io[6]A)-hydroxylase [Flavobacteriales bacterium]|nr:tRNA-(ms[2]io[6]A)-hydroxylase [Flavobacteriales bacterium]